MNKHKPRLKHPLRLALAVLAVSVIALTACVMLARKPNDVSSVMQPVNEAGGERQDAADMPDQTTPSPTPDTRGFVTVDAWNVKFALPASLNGTEVLYLATGEQDGTATYGFTTGRVRALGGECAQDGRFPNIAVLSRSLEKPVAVPDGELVSETPIGGYYYAVGGPSVGCSAFNANGGMRSESSTETADRAALKSALKSLVATD